MNPSWEGFAAPRHSEVISPELALVDPVLAESARAYLPEPRAASPERVVDPDQLDAARARASTALSDAALAMDDEFGKPVADGRSWLGLVGVAAVAVLSLLLLDVRVQVGKTPASAETSQEPLSAPSVLVRPPLESVTKPEHENGGERATKPSENGGERATKPSARRFAWAPAPGASGYHIEFFKGTMLVFSASTTKPHLTVPARWSEAKETRSLTSGEYRWYVWPVNSGGTRSSQAIVQAKLVVR